MLLLGMSLHVADIESTNSTPIACNVPIRVTVIKAVVSIDAQQLEVENTQNYSFHCKTSVFEFGIWGKIK